MSNTQNIYSGIILAAGQGTRMKSKLPKVAHEILGRPLIVWSIETLIQSGIYHIVIVLSPNQQEVEDILRKTEWSHPISYKIAYQTEPLGTGHAVQSAMTSLYKIIEENNYDPKVVHTIIGFGDTPAVDSESLKGYLKDYQQNQNDCSILAFQANDPTGYGRILINQNNEFLQIKEDKECSWDEKKVTLCNSGYLCVKYSCLDSYIHKLNSNNESKEYYLTDLPEIMKSNKFKVGVFSEISEEELGGVNNQKQLAKMAKFIQNRIIEYWMNQGVQFLDPEAVYLEPSITLESGCIVEPFVFLKGKKQFSKNTIITSGTRIEE